MTDLRAAHKRAIGFALRAEEGDDTDFRMSWRERQRWLFIEAWGRVRDAVLVLRGQAQIRMNDDFLR